MKGLLLRVGIDKGSGGCLAPIFENGLFEYIPIPEIWPTSETKVYATMEGEITGIPIVNFEIPKEKFRYAQPHDDPDFISFTYGDPTEPKRNQLSNLKPGNLLIFYAGLKPYDRLKLKPKKGGKSRLYVIGYFDVEKVYDFKRIMDYDSVFKKMPNNAHSKRYFRLKELNVKYLDDKLVIVKGKSGSSERLLKALPLGDNNNKMRKELEPIFGYKGCLQRAVGHRIDRNHIHNVKEWLENRRIT
jgi:hypothetical protein